MGKPGHMVTVSKTILFFLTAFREPTGVLSGGGNFHSTDYQGQFELFCPYEMP